MINFALIGAAGYIAPRHLKAIKSVGGNLLAAYDIADSVGVLDQYFPGCNFFTDEFEFYNRLLDDLHVDYMVICSPNYLHEEHCRNALKLGVDIICEKPLVLTINELEQLQELEHLTQKNIYTILQLRLHPLLKQLKEEIKDKKYNVNIEYFTPRGNWYHASWKGDVKKSGGIATNIGIHLFDLATWLFGEVIEISVEKNTATESIGNLQLKNADVNWHLSIENEMMPKRQFIIDGKTYEFTEAFSDLHTISYEHILNKKGFTTVDVKPSIDIVERIRNL
ncbi:MAG: gfo/Idh/MocA family oxidoreductase [Bacteroidota bacterium]|nr:gfo/Idh/MocA family oxidoreductase [Bacteroidota bacterium]